MDAVRLVAPQRVWVEGPQVLAEACDGQTFIMTAEVALRMGRLLGQAGETAIVNRLGLSADVREGPVGTP